MNPLMLPSAPKDVGRLSAVLPSALASLGLDFPNVFRLPKVNHSVVILVDGLGFENLKKAGAHAKFLNHNLENSIRCEFPSTTATSIAGFATGQRSNSHGIIGYTVYDRLAQAPMNLLTGWQSSEQASNFKREVSLSEKVDIRFEAVGPAVYENSGFTELTMKGANYTSAETIADRFRSLKKIVDGERSFTYLYIPELDQIAHRQGVDSLNWLDTLEEIDSAVEKFVQSLPKGVGVILTADHGVLDVPHSKHFFLDDLPWFSDAVTRTGGDPRCNFIYLNDSSNLIEVKKALVDSLGHSAHVVEPEDLSESGWAGWESANEINSVPDLVIIWQDIAVGYDRRTASKNSTKMVGQHGGISDQETRIPLITLGSY